MGKHSGESHAAPPAARGPLALLAAGISATLIAWGFLVWVAIDFGAEARAGDALAWVFLVLATIGATACLFLTLLLGSKILGALGGEPRPPKRGPRH